MAELDAVAMGAVVVRDEADAQVVAVAVDMVAVDMVAVDMVAVDMVAVDMVAVDMGEVDAVQDEDEQVLEDVVAPGLDMADALGLDQVERVPEDAHVPAVVGERGLVAHSLDLVARDLVPVAPEIRVLVVVQGGPAVPVVWIRRDFLLLGQEISEADQHNPKTMSGLKPIRWFFSVS